MPQNTSYTSEDYWNLPENERAELIKGQLYAMAPPNRIHQKLITKFTAAIENYVSGYYFTVIRPTSEATCCPSSPSTKSNHACTRSFCSEISPLVAITKGLLKK